VAEQLTIPQTIPVWYCSYLCSPEHPNEQTDCSTSLYLKIIQ